MGTEIMKYFPLATPRPAQVAALDFIERMVVEHGAEDIVIEAPTGAGKSAIGATCCNWAANWGPIDMGDGILAKAGGFYLVAQRMLQQQIIDDVHAVHKFHDFGSLWSANNYICDGGKATNEQREMVGLEAEKEGLTCGMGMMEKKPKCNGRKCGSCPYIQAKIAFENSHFSLTNYPWFLTERMFVGKLQPRNIMILDEAHGLERQLLKFGEIELNEKLLRDWNIRGLRVPEIDDKQDFANWLEEKYLPIIRSRLEDSTLEAQAMDDRDPQLGKIVSTITALENQVHKIVSCVSGVRVKPADWVYWFDQTDDKGNVAYCKPLEAAPYMDLIREGSCVRVYMSAFPGEKGLFCKSLGLDQDTIAWKRLPSEFPVANRPVVLGLVGSMSLRNQETTLPSLLRVVDKIMTQHANEKGIIHCHSYKLGKKIFSYLQKTKHAKRVLFPENAESREALFERHVVEKDNPTVLLSPSMGEGYDFKDDLARWQVIAKIPYPYLGDKQVEAKKDRDQSWYDLQTVMHIVQAAGRVCRSVEDHGTTYVLDADFKSLWEKRKTMFPAWFRESVVLA